MTHTLAPGWTALDLTKENLRLYAAAPELLEALKEAIKSMEYAAMVLDAPHKSIMRENITTARAAIAKAEGKE